MHPDWVRSIRDLCAAADVPFLMKQWGDWAPVNGALDWCELDDHPEISRFQYKDWDETQQAWSDPYSLMWCDDVEPGTMGRIGKKAAGRMLDGVLHNEYPTSGG